MVELFKCYNLAYFLIKSRIKYVTIKKNLPKEEKLITLKIIFMKKKDSTGKPVNTYELGRACLYCGEPIADQARKSKFHCTEYKDEFGVTHNCRRRKYQLKHQLSEDVLLDWCAMQRKTKIQIEEVIKAHGDVVKVEILDAYNVILDNRIRSYQYSGQTIMEFLGYNIIITPNCKTFKIQKNDKQ